MAAKSNDLLKRTLPSSKEGTDYTTICCFLPYLTMEPTPHGTSPMRCRTERTGPRCFPPESGLKALWKCQGDASAYLCSALFLLHHSFLHTDSSFTARPASSSTTFLYPQSNSRIDDVIHMHTGFESLESLWQAYCTLYKGQCMQHKL